MWRSIENGSRDTLTYEVLGITDTGDPETSHLDLAVTFNPAMPLA